MSLGVGSGREELNTAQAIHPSAPEGVLVPESDVVESPSLFDYLQTDKGHAVVTQVLGMIQGLQRATLDANAEQNKQQLTNNSHQQAQQVEFQHKTYRFSMWLQGVIFVCCILATGLLAWNDKLSGTATTVICTTLGFIFGRSGRGQ
jgi:hypothetical protein